jgi:hypothetical protein
MVIAPSRTRDKQPLGKSCGHFLRVPIGASDGAEPHGTASARNRNEPRAKQDDDCRNQYRLEPRNLALAADLEFQGAWF